MRILIVLLSLALLAACSRDEAPKKKAAVATVPTAGGLSSFEVKNGIGPVKEPLRLGPVDKTLAAQGEAIFEMKCTACHKLDERYIGPAQRYVTERRTPEYIINMMLNPEEMTKKHPLTQKLLVEYLVPMPSQNLTMDEALKLLDFLRLKAQEGHEKNIAEIPIFRNPN